MCGTLRLDDFHENQERIQQLYEERRRKAEARLADIYAAQDASTRPVEDTYNDIRGQRFRSGE